LLPYPQQGSAAIRALPWSTGLARLPAGTQIRDGESVQYYDFRHWLS
jgi:molybdopterin molybdotransferase